MKAVDLFAGAGGFSLGVEQAGFEVTHALEIDEWACQTLRTNHPGARVVQDDIQHLDNEWVRREIPKYPDLMIGGPPCQGFSHAGPRNKDPRDPRNSLFREFVRVAQILEPRTVVIENVPGILRARTADARRVKDVIVGELESLGFITSILVLEAQTFGVPQIRRRVFFLGSQDFQPPEELDPTHGDQASLFSPGKLDLLTLRDAIGDLPQVDVGDDGPIKYEGPPTNDFQLSMREGATDPLENHLPMRHTSRTIERFRTIKPGQSQSHVDASLAPRMRVRTEAQGPGRYDQNNRRMFWDKPCHTLAATFYANFVHPELDRNFTPREGARVQTFPDRYVFRGKATVVSNKLLAREGRHAERHLCQYVQIGNAVPPRLAYVLGSRLRRMASSESVASRG